jgi:Tetratricopeptide repeat
MKSRNHLADAYRTAGRLEEAIPLYERNLADRGHVFGKTHVTETVYRHVIVPEIGGGATVMDDVFNDD